jgi:diacylglycerol O-acyltransferase
MVDTRREPVASVDSAWLRMDEPGNLMVVNGVIVLSDPVPFERYRDLLANHLPALPRLRQRIVKSGNTSGALVWEPDPHFDLSYHLRLAPLEHADQASLQNLVGRVMGDAFDPRRPLWQFHFVPHYEDGCAVICRFHHCIGDGLALLYVLLMLTDDPPTDVAKAEAQPTAKSRPGLLRRSLSPLVSFTRTVEESVVHEVKEIISRPARALDVTRDLSISAGAAGKLLLMSSDPRTLFKGPLTDEKRAVWSQGIAIDTLKEIARVTGSKINDVVLAAVAGGLRRYLLSREQPVHGLELRAVVPVNLRPMEQASELGNRFGLVFVPLPLGIDDPLDRIFAVRNRTQEIKRSPEALLTFQILRMLGVTPSPLFETVVNLFGRRATAVMTNVIGPREPLRMAGTTLKQVIFWVPCSGHLGIGVSIFSYVGNLWVGIATDASLVPDPQVIIDGFESEMTTLMELARQVRPEPVAAPPPPVNV